MSPAEAAMARPSVLVLYNQPLLPGDHPEAVSEHSVIEIAERVARLLDAADFRVSALALGSDPSVLWTELKKRKPDVVFNLYEGQLDNAESETHVAGLLEWSGVAYTGSPPQALALARAKDTTKYLWRGAGLPSADFLVVNAPPLPACPLKFPVIVKPARLDASVGVEQKSVCTDHPQIEERVRYVLTTYGPPVLIEEYIAGREFHVPLVELADLQTLPPLEINFANERPDAWPILTYNGKWTTTSAECAASYAKFPADLSTSTLHRLGQVAAKAFRLIGCRDYARVDFRMNEQGKLFILEVNPNPEISEDAGFGSPEFPFDAFVIRLVEQAMSRKHAPKPTFAPIVS
jgi:D-alanine-D-alanine ligase